MHRRVPDSSNLSLDPIFGNDGGWRLINLSQASNHPAAKRRSRTSEDKSQYWQLGVNGTGDLEARGYDRLSGEYSLSMSLPPPHFTEGLQCSLHGKHLADLWLYSCADDERHHALHVS